MTSWILPIALSALLLGQDERADAQLDLREVRLAVQRLGDRDFARREEAYRFLWSQGLAAKPELERALKSSDGEVRSRARRLLSDFDYGLLPGTPAALMELIRNFRDGNGEVRQQAYQKLLEAKEFKIVERLIRLERQPEARRTLLSELVQHPKAVEAFIELDRIEALLDAVAADQDAEWRKLISIQLMFSPKVIEHLAGKKQLDGVLKLIQDEKQADLRQRMLAQIFQNATTVAEVIEQKQLSFLFAAIKTEPDKALRSQWVSALVSNQAAAQKLLEQNKLGELLEFAETHIATESQGVVLTQILQSPAITQALLKEGGIDRLIELVSREKHAPKRGKLMATAIASPALRGQLQGRALADLVIAAAKKEQDATARREMLLALFETDGVIYAFSDADSLRVLWRFVREDNDRAWQARAVAPLLRVYRSQSPLADPEEAAWVLQLVQDEATATVRDELLVRLLGNSQIHDMLIGHGHSATILTLAKSMPDQTRGQVLRSLAASRALGQELVAKDEVELLVALVKDEQHPATRIACLQGILTNYTAMPQLIQKGHYDTLLKLIEAEEDLQQRGMLLGDFINGNGVLDEMVKREVTGLLLTYCDLEHEGGRTQFRMRLFQNARAIGILVDQGKYDELLAIARQDDAALLDEFVAVPQVIERLFAKKEFRGLFDLVVKQGAADTRRQLLQRIFSNQETIKKLIAAEEFDHVFAFVASEPDGNWRSSLLNPVLSSAEVIRYFAESDKLKVLFDMIAAEPEPNLRNQMLSYLTSRNDAVSLLIDRGQLDAILQAVKKYADGRMRGDMLARVLLQPKALQQLKGAGRLTVLLDFVRSADEKDDAVQAYANALFANDAAISLLIAADHFDELWLAARRQPDTRRGVVLARLTASRAVSKHLQQAGTLHSLVELVQSEKHEPTQLACLRGLFSNAEAMPELLQGEHYQTFRGLIDRQQDPVQRATLLGDFLNANTAAQQIIAHKELDLLLEYADHENEAARKQFRIRLFRSSQALTLLLDEGHLEKLVAMAKEDNGALLTQLLVVPKAIQQLIAVKQFDVLLKFATEHADANARRNFLQGIVYNRETLQALIANDLIDTVLTLVKEEREPYVRESLLNSLLSLPAVIRYYAKAGKLDSIFALLPANSNRSNNVLFSVLSRSEVISILVEQERLEETIAYIQTHAAGATRGQLLGQLLTNTKALEWLKANKKTDLLLSLAEPDAKQPDAQATQVYLTRILGYPIAIDMLIADGHFDKLLELTKKQPDAVRGPALRSLVASHAVAQHFSKNKQLVALLELVLQEEHPLARQAALGGLFQNAVALPQLLAAGHYATLKKEVEAVADPVQRGVLFGDFLRGPGVLEELVKQGEIDLLLTYAEVEDDNARQQFLTRLFQNRNALGLLVDKGHYDKLLSLAQQGKGELMGAFLNTPQVLKHLADAKQLDVLFTFASKTAEEQVRRNLLQQIAYTEESLKLIIEAGEFPRLLQLATSEAESSYRGSIIGTLLGSRSVIEHLGQAGKLDVVADTLRSEVDPALRSQIVANVINRSAGIEVFVASNKLDTLLTLVSQYTDDNARGQLLARVLTNSKSIDQLKAEKKIEQLLSVGEGLNPSSARAYWSQMFAYSQVIDLLLEHGHYDRLMKLAMAGEGQWLPQLLSNNKAVKELLKSGQLPVLVEFAKTTDNDTRRRAYLTLFFGNEQLVEALAEQKQLGDLIELCRSEPDESVRNRNLATLLLSPLAIDRLEDEELARIVKLVANEPDATHRQRFLNDLLMRAPTVSKLLEKGHFETLFVVAAKGMDESSRYSLMMRVLGNREGLAQLAAAGKMPMLLKMLAELPGGGQRDSLIHRAVTASGFLDAVVESGQLESLLQHVDAIEHEGVRRSALASVFGSPTVLVALARREQLQIVFDRIEKEQDSSLTQRCLQTLVYNPLGRPILADGKIADQFVTLLKHTDESQRVGFLRMFANNSSLRQAWVAAGKVSQLQELAALFPLASDRTRLQRQILYSPAGVFGHLVASGKLAEAEQLLRDAEGDEGINQLVAYLAVEGRIEDEAAKVQKRYDAEPSAKDARLLVFLLRAQGDLAATQRLAESIADPALLRLLLVERRDWPRATALQKEAAICPVRAQGAASVEELKYIEELGLLAAYQQLSGQAEEYGETVQQIQDFAAADRSKTMLGWHCAEVLLLNGEVEPGLEIASWSKPLTAMNLFVFRHDYDRALAALGWKDETAIDLAWYEALPSDSGSAYQTAINRFNRALQIAATLRTAGREADADSLLQFLEKFALDAPTNGSPNRESYLRHMSGRLYRMGLTERALAIGAVSVGIHTNYANVLNDLYGTDSQEARQWWSVFHSANADEPPATRLERVHRLMRPGVNGPPEDLDDLIKQTQKYGETLAGSTSEDDYWYAIGTTCRRHGRNEAAAACFARSPGNIRAVRALADLLASEQRWEEAAAQYEAVWQLDHQQVGALYLAGDALRRSGQDERAKELQQLAQRLAVQGLVRHQLLRDMESRGLPDEVAEQCEFLLKTAGPGSWELNDAARRKGDHTFLTDPALAADLWQHYVFGTFPSQIHFSEDLSYLRMPLLIHKMRLLAAIRAEQWDVAASELELAQRPLPGDSPIVEEFVPLLDAAGQTALADAAVDRLVQHYQTASEKFPGVASLHNNIAWTAARCHRRLDEALAHAEKAVALTPDNAGHVDTLAEVHFHLGDRDKAIHFSQRSIELRPGDPSLARQLQRFRDEPLPSAAPNVDNRP